MWISRREIPRFHALVTTSLRKRDDFVTHISMARTGLRTGMRVLHVIAGAKGGGAESIMLDAVAALAEAGVSQHVITRGGKARLAALEAAGVSYEIAHFDKDSREP